MAWEWVAPVSTATVGVAGVAGTYLSARMGRKAAADQAREHRDHSKDERNHAERREAYTGFLEAAVSAQHAFGELLRLQIVSPSEHEKIAEIYNRTAADLTARRELVRLTGPDHVRGRALDLAAHLFAALAAAANGEDFELDHDLNASLLAAMKQDLGYELSPVDEAALARPASGRDAVLADPSRTEDES